MGTNNQLMDLVNGQADKENVKLPKKAKASELFDVLRQFRKDENNKDNKTLQIYCASFQLALLESQADKQLSNVIFDEIQMEKSEYEQILSLMEQQKKYFKQFAYKNLLISLCLSIAVYGIIAYLLKLSVVLAAACAVLILLVDIFANGKTNGKRYQQKWIKTVQKKVDEKIIAVTTKYFK